MILIKHMKSAVFGVRLVAIDRPIQDEIPYLMAGPEGKSVSLHDYCDDAIFVGIENLRSLRIEEK